MALFVGMPVFASGSQTISIPKNQNWTSKYSDSRSKSYSYVSAGCESVYPSTGDDNFKKIQVRVVTSQGMLIMNDSYKVLEEGKGVSEIDVKEGYLGLEQVSFQFRGNSNSAAKAVVNYDGN